MKISWSEFKVEVSKQLDADLAFWYRGQRLASWGLRSTLHRTTIVRSWRDWLTYVNVLLPHVHDDLAGWLGRRWNLNDELERAEFFAFLQHNGFPTPLLDWSRSPYIAAYFAFERVDHFNPQTEDVAIFAFNQKEWRGAVAQVGDVGQQLVHVSVLQPRAYGNQKLALQQGAFTWGPRKTRSCTSGGSRTSNDSSSGSTSST